MTAINRGFFISAVISAVLVVVAAFVSCPRTVAELRRGLRHGGTSCDCRAETVQPALIAIGAVLIGIVLAAAMQVLTGYFTETNRQSRGRRGASPH